MGILFKVYITNNGMDIQYSMDNSSFSIECHLLLQIYDCQIYTCNLMLEMHSMQVHTVKTKSLKARVTTKKRFWQRDKEMSSQLRC